MASDPWQLHAAPSDTARWYFTAAVSGAVAVLVFHQGAIGILNDLGFTAQRAFSTEPAIFGVPQVWSLMPWGVLWGLALGFALRRLDSTALVVGAAAFGAVLPTLMALVAMEADSLLALALAHAAWGAGTGVGLNLFGRSHARGRFASF